MRGRASFSQGQDGNEDCSVPRTPCGHRLWPVPSDDPQGGDRSQLKLDKFTVSSK